MKRVLDRASFAMLTAVAFAAVQLLGTPASAEHASISYGDARAHFNAATTAGRVIQLGPGTPAIVNAGPANFFEAGIRPFPGGPWDGASFCVDDWHVILLAIFDGGDQTFKYSDAVASLSGVEIDWILDGASVAETERTPIKAFLHPEVVGLERAFGFQDGTFVAPGDLTIGEHSLEADITDPVFGDFSLAITFNVDPPGLGACV